LGKPAADAEAAEAATPPPRQLPLSCSGCGAFAQTTDRNQLGFFDLESKHVRRWLNPKRSSAPATEVDAPENQVVESVLAGLDEATLKELGLDSEKLIVQEAPVKVQGKLPVVHYWNAAIGKYADDSLSARSRARMQPMPPAAP
jgi:hypothetical protein